LYDSYVDKCLTNEDPEIHNRTIDQVNAEAIEYLKYKYVKFKTEYKQYKVISRIEKKYNIDNEDSRGFTVTHRGNIKEHIKI